MDHLLVVARQQHCDWARPMANISQVVPVQRLGWDGRCQGFACKAQLPDHQSQRGQLGHVVSREANLGFERRGCWGEAAIGLTSILPVMGESGLLLDRLPQNDFVQCSRGTGWTGSAAACTPPMSEVQPRCMGFSSPADTASRGGGSVRNSSANLKSLPPTVLNPQIHPDQWPHQAGNVVGHQCVLDVCS